MFLVLLWLILFSLELAKCPVYTGLNFQVLNFLFLNHKDSKNIGNPAYAWTKFLIDLIHRHSYSRALKSDLRETEIFLSVILKFMEEQMIIPMR